jgi:ABC-type glycerol-3-phosphate transport system permease component
MSLHGNASHPPIIFCFFEGSSAQIVCGIFIALVYIKLYGSFRPYKKDDDDVLQEMAQFQVYITLFISLLIRVGTYSHYFLSSLDCELPITAESVFLTLPTASRFRNRAEAFKGHNWTRALDISLIVANLATSFVFFHSLMTARNYYVFRRDAANSEKNNEKFTDGIDAEGCVWE